MAWGFAVELAEQLEVFEADVVSRQMQQRIEQHAAMAGREHEAVAIVPRWIGRVMLHVFGPERIRCGGHSHRHSRVAGLGLLYAFHRKEADRLDTKLVKFGQTWILYKFTHLLISRNQSV